MCHNGANRTERGARGPESGIGAAAQALVQGSAWSFVRGSARGCAGYAEASSALEQGGLRNDCGGECCGGKCCGGRAIGMEGGRGAAADGVAGRRGARVVVVVVVVSCGWPLAGLLRDCCGRLAGCGGSRVQAGAAVTGTCCGRLAALGEECSGGGMRGDCRFCCGMGRRMDVEELTGRRGVAVVPCVPMRVMPSPF